MTPAVSKMDGRGLINITHCECLPERTKVILYYLQKDYLKNGVLQLKRSVGECVAMHLKEG